MTLRVTVSAPAAVSRIAPPSARIGLAVFDQCVECLGADAQAHQPVAGEVERDSLAGTQATVPCGALIVPALVIVGAMKAT